MTTKRLRTTGVLAAALIIPLAAVSAATPATAEAMATVSVLHAIPAGKGADVVDVYAGSAMLIDNFTPADEEEFDQDEDEDGDVSDEARTLAGMEGGNQGLAEYDGLELDDREDDHEYD